jgi:hypothetical protein
MQTKTSAARMAWKLCTGPALFSLAAYAAWKAFLAIASARWLKKNRTESGVEMQKYL